MADGPWAFVGAGLALLPGPLQLFTDRLDPGRDLFELFSLNPAPPFQGLANLYDQVIGSFRVL